MITMIDDFMMI